MNTLLRRLGEKASEDATKLLGIRYLRTVRSGFSPSHVDSLAALHRGVAAGCSLRRSHVDRRMFTG